jgi:hypothetical protein
LIAKIVLKEGKVCLCIIQTRGKAGIYHTSRYNPKTQKTERSRSTGTNDENKAHEIAQKWLEEGWPGGKVRSQKHYAQGIEAEIPQAPAGGLRYWSG